jgi:hypothetical protein
VRSNSFGFCPSSMKNKSMSMSQQKLPKLCKLWKKKKSSSCA